MPLDYLGWFAVVLRGMHGKVDICQTDYSIHSKLRTFFYSKIIHGSTTFKVMKGKKVKEKWSTIKFDHFVFSYIFLVPVSQTITVIKKWHRLYFTCIKLMACVLGCASAIAQIKWRRLHTFTTEIDALANSQLLTVESISAPKSLTPGIYPRNFGV